MFLDLLEVFVCGCCEAVGSLEVLVCAVTRECCKMCCCERGLSMTSAVNVAFVAEYAKEKYSSERTRERHL